MLEEIAGTLVGRWYVTLFGITFVVLATRHLGVRRMLSYAGVAILFGVIVENGSVHLGVPYTRYAFNPALRGHELFVGDVPLMVSLSYTFMAYFAFASARLIIAGPYRTRGRLPVLEYLTAVMLAVWALWVVDPVSRLGAHFFLGELFRYDGPGFWFGLPLGSQLGFVLTAGVLVGVLTWLARDEPAQPVDRLRDHPRLGALGGFAGQVVFMAATAFVVARTSGDPGVVKTADALAGSAAIIAIPMIVLVAVHWRSITVARRPDAIDRPDRPDRDDQPDPTDRVDRDGVPRPSAAAS